VLNERTNRQGLLLLQEARRRCGRELEPNGRTIGLVAGTRADCRLRKRESCVKEPRVRVRLHEFRHQLFEVNPTSPSPKQLLRPLLPVGKDYGSKAVCISNRECHGWSTLREPTMHMLISFLPRRDEARTKSFVVRSTRNRFNFWQCFVCRAILGLRR